MEFYKEKFREIRKKLRWSITSLATTANTSRQYISSWESGKKIPSEKKIRLLANIMNIKVSDISNLKDTYPHSDLNKFNTLKDNCFIQSFNKDSIEPNIKNIYKILTEINIKFSELSLISQSLLKYSNNHIYIKDYNLRYIIANKAFLKNINLTEDFRVNGKLDNDFYIESEAKLNTKLDSHVIVTGKPILDHEQYIFGTRKKKWGIYSKIPIFDAENKITGILNIVVDITERKKQEKEKEILEYAIRILNNNFWIAKGFNSKPGEYLFNEIIFSSRNNINSKIVEDFWGEKSSENFSMEELRKIIWQSSHDNELAKIVEKLKKEKSFPVELSYKLISPYTNKEFIVTENIVHDSKLDIYVGKITFENY